MRTFSVSQALRFGLDAAKRHLVAFLGVMLATIGIVAAFLMLEAFLRFVPLAAGTAWLAYELFLVFLNVTLLASFLKIARGAHMTFDDVVDEFERTLGGWKTVAHLAVAGAIYEFLVAAGLILLVVPGIYIAIKYSQIFYLILDKHRSLPVPPEGKLSAKLRYVAREYQRLFREAGGLTDGVKWRLVALGIASFCIMLIAIIPGILTFGVGFVFAGILIQAAFAHAYVELSCHPKEREA